MKKKKTMIVVVMAMLVSLAFSVPAGAIGFDAEQAYASVFVVYSGEALGSGFAIGEDCIVSNAHVIDDQRDIEVASYDGAVFDAHIVLIEENLDIVILKVEGQTFPYLKVADYNDTAIGADVYAIGAPNSMAYTLTKGVLSAKDRDLGRYEYLQIDAALNSGNSGGPLLNDAGEVIGVNTLKMSDSEGIGLAIPMTTVCEYLQNNDPVYICPVIIQEILQGIKDEEEYNLIKGYLFVLNILNDDGIEVAIGAAEIFRNLRQKGLTIRKSNDCIIAYYAIKYSLKILHCDRDFDTILNHYRSY
jgi:serine protease Do